MTPTATIDRLAEMRDRAAKADAAAAAMQAELDAEVADRVAARDERVRQWAQATIDQHRERDAQLRRDWQEARALFLSGVVDDLSRAPELWAAWATVTAQLYAEHEAFMTATASLDPRRWDREPVPQAPTQSLPTFTDALNQAFETLAANLTADQLDSRQSELSDALTVEGV
jgi:hypothetical protein